MPHHKRRRPKNRRAGCLMCKFWKVNGAKRMKESIPYQTKKANANYKEMVGS